LPILWTILQGNLTLREMQCAELAHFAVRLPHPSYIGAISRASRQAFSSGFFFRLFLQAFSSGFLLRLSAFSISGGVCVCCTFCETRRFAKRER
jgi:hypothetical protein